MCNVVGIYLHAVTCTGSALYINKVPACSLYRERYNEQSFLVVVFVQRYTTQGVQHYAVALRFVPRHCECICITVG